MRYDWPSYARLAAKVSPVFRDNTAGLSRTIVNGHYEGVGEIMIGPPGLPKYGRRVFAFAASKRSRSRQHQHSWKWVTGLYLAGVLAHFSHHMVGLPDGSSPSSEALASAPVSLVWPADLMKTLITLS
jgi:hypothetical protein